MPRLTRIRCVWRWSAGARRARQPPPVAISLPEHVRSKDTLVTPHRLDIYDQITGGTDELA